MRMLLAAASFAGHLGLVASFAPFPICRMPSSQPLHASVEMDDTLPPAATRVLDCLKASLSEEQQLLLETYLGYVLERGNDTPKTKHAAEAKANMQLALADKELELQTFKLRHDLMYVNAQLMRLRGLLNMPGILWFIEPRYREEHYQVREKREDIWAGVLQEHPTLAACITKKTGWKPEAIPQRISSLYDTLNKHSRAAPSPCAWRDEIAITNAHQTTLPDCHALACICEHFNIRYELRLLPPPDAGAVLTQQ
eukprot:TRINITY_DN18626_c0_g1_i1.p1 TRINITY_DN18626_c0_g1~~TRINITY_DN18626_c0_g1_i1.p1  ORF type:complete len:264 (-),score=53.96 TRINITY_DN18626_c0_g1_i1:121-882(-)